jgi:hypothetical protein
MFPTGFFLNYWKKWQIQQPTRAEDPLESKKPVEVPI